MIVAHHNQDYFVLGMDKEDRMSNTYAMSSYDKFSTELTPYKKIEAIKYADYLNLKKEKLDCIEGNDNKLEPFCISLSDLPF